MEREMEREIKVTKIKISREEFEEFIKLEEGEMVCDINFQDSIHGNFPIQILVERTSHGKVEQQQKNEPPRKEAIV